MQGPVECEKCARKATAPKRRNSPYTLGRRGVTWCHIRRFERDVRSEMVWAVRRYMALHRVLRARRVRKNGTCSETWRGVASGDSCETSGYLDVTPRQKALEHSSPRDARCTRLEACNLDANTDRPGTQNMQKAGRHAMIWHKINGIQPMTPVA